MQIRTLRLCRAVLAAVVKRAADGEEMTKMTKLAEAAPNRPAVLAWLLWPSLGDPAIGMGQGT